MQQKVYGIYGSIKNTEDVSFIAWVFFWSLR